MIYKELVFNEDAILNLYLKNEWFAYTNKKDLLFEGIKNSLYTLACYDDNQLVGLVRCVGDNATILYIQDILVLPSYQHQGIGSSLLRRVLEKYSEIRQVVLMTDNTEKQQNFYIKNGFVKHADVNCVGFIYKG